MIELFERNERFDDLAYILALRCYRAIILNQLGRYDETSSSSTSSSRPRYGGASKAERTGCSRSCVPWPSPDWSGGTSSRRSLRSDEPIDQMLGSSYGFRIRAPAARLAAHRGDTEMVAYHARVVMDYVEAFGFSFDAPGMGLRHRSRGVAGGTVEDDARRLLEHTSRGR